MTRRSLLKHDKKSKISINVPCCCYDILERILPSLPVKSLLRFKSVSKQLYALISSPAFVSSHLRSVRPVTRFNLTGYPYIVEPELSPWLLTIPSIHSHFSEISALEIDHNPFDAPIEPHVFASCNGLLLVAVGSENMFLWNPSTREHVKLFGREYTHSWNIQDTEHNIHHLVGMGYNSRLDEYKVIVYIHEDYRRGDFCTYSSKFGYRDKVPNNFPYLLLDSCDAGVTVNGCPHWILPNCTYSSHNEEPVLMYYDVIDEEFKSLLTPTEWRVASTRYGSEPELSVLRGCLCATHISPDYEEDASSVVWIMNEYGVGDSWSKLFVISPSVVEHSFKPLGFTKKGDQQLVLAGDDGSIVKYNANSNNCETVISSRSTARTWARLDPVEFTESLVSPGPVVMTGKEKRMVAMNTRGYVKFRHIHCIYILSILDNAGRTQLNYNVPVKSVYGVHYDSFMSLHPLGL